MAYFLDQYGDEFKILVHGLEKWGLVEFNEDGSGYNAGDTYFETYKHYYIHTVPRALSTIMKMLTNVFGVFDDGGKNIWTVGNGKYCRYKEYFDHLLSMSKIHRCEVLHFMNDRCSNKDLNTFLEKKKRIEELFEEHCWGKIWRYSIH